MLYGSLMHSLPGQTRACFVLDDFFKVVCMVNSLGRQRRCLPLEQRAALFTVQYNKENVFLWVKFRHACCLL